MVLNGSGLTRKNSLKGKVIGITDATSMAALKSSGLAEKAAAVWTYDDLIACFNALAAGDCDALATTCLLLGSEKGMALIEQLEDFEAVFITRDGELLQTSGMTGFTKM